ncbi:subtilase family serine protease [Catenulispora sp. MAP12-49]|uniref:S53 family peptidase n=1 Tax=Catenulispora sp. MAP12-49 TaxID=3156302 RepID=UPI00351984FE
MVGRFGHVTATLAAAALMAAPNAVSAATTGAASVDGPTTARIGLAGADPDGLRQFATAVADPHSAQYRRFLTPAQVQEKFGPTAAQLKQVHQWLADGGLRVTGENSHWIDVAGTSDEVKKAFGHPPQPRITEDEGYEARAAAAVPAELAGTVSSVAGLVPEPQGMRQFSYRVTAGPRHRALPGDGINPGGPMQPATLEAPTTRVDPGGPMQPSGPGTPTANGPVAPSGPRVGVNPGGPMQPSGPGTPTANGPVAPGSPTVGVNPGGPMQPNGPGTPTANGTVAPGSPTTGVNPGGPMQPSGPGASGGPVIVGGPIKRSLPADAGDPTLPATTSAACSSDWGGSPATGLPEGYNKPDPLVACGYSPKRLRAAYGVTASGFSGKGAIIGIVDAYGSPTMHPDADRFAKSVGDKAFGTGQYLESVDRGAWKHLGDDVCETPAAWGGEEALDVEMAHGLAPDAVVHYFGAASCQDSDIAAALASVVDKHAADLVTGSFGEIMHSAGGDIDPALVAQEEQIFTAGAAEGIGFAFATGDCGDQAAGLDGPGCDQGSGRPQLEWPAASPWVTAVGGTALALAPDGTRHWEAPMGDLRSDLSGDGSKWAPLPGQFYFGGGGGASTDFGRPAYQKGVVPAALAHPKGKASLTPMRTVPDVAMDGDLLTAVLTGHTDPTLGGYGQDVVGGTSAAAPMFVAVQADAMQAAGGALGFANPALYKRAGTKQLTDIVASPKGAPKTISAVVDHGMFGAVHEARLFKLGADHGLRARRGYDTATGLGSPTAAYITSYKPAPKEEVDGDKNGDKKEG